MLQGGSARLAGHRMLLEHQATQYQTACKELLLHPCLYGLLEPNGSH